MKTIIDHYFDEGWKRFVKQEQRKSQRHSERLLAVVEQIKGVEFVEQLIGLMRTCGTKHPQLIAVRKPVGVELSDKRFALIPQIWYEARRSELGAYAEVCVQVKPNRWLKFFAPLPSKEPRQISVF